MSIERIERRPADVAGGQPRRHGLSRRPSGRSGRAKASANRRRRFSATSTACSREAGSDKTRILSATHLSRRHRDFRRNERGWEAWVAPGHTPARATVEAKLAAPQYTVEIVCVAANAELRICHSPNIEEERSALTQSSTAGARSSGSTSREAVDLLARAVRRGDAGAARGARAVPRRTGEPPSRATRALFRYPELRLTYAPNGPPPSSPRAFAKFSDARRLRDDGHAARRLSRLSARAARAAGRRIRRRRSRSASARRRSPTPT